MKCSPPSPNPFDIDALREEYAFTPDLDELATVIAVWAHPTRMRLFALLDQVEQMCVCDLAAVLGISVSAVSQNLAKMRAQRLVQFRRDAQTLYYALTDHPINAVVRQAVRGARERVGE